MRASLLATALLAGSALAASPVPGFRPPATPLLTQSPLINLWSTTDQLNGGTTSFWTGDVTDMCAAIRVDGTSYLLMGSATQVWSNSTLATAHQVGLPTVYATQTKYTFIAGAVTVNLTFNSPLLTDDWELLSRPAHYVTFDVAANDAGAHAVQLYFDLSSQMVVNSGSQSVAWARNPVTGEGITGTVEALGVGNAVQTPLSSTSDRMNWGVAYLVLNTDASDPTHATGSMNYANTTRAAFFASGAPAADLPASLGPLPVIGGQIYTPATGPQTGIDRPGGDMPGSPFTLASADPDLCWAACNKTAGCVNWAYAVPNCDGYPQPTCWLKGSDQPTVPQSCRVSGRQAGYYGQGFPFVATAVYDLGAAVTSTGASRVVTIAVDEFLQIDWFGMPMPPYWRRALPVGNTSVVPTDMLATAYSEYAAVKTACDLFDAQTAGQLSAAGGDNYATLAQLTYRQVFGAMALVWHPEKETAWYFLKEISSCGCLNTADVVYPAFPQILYYSPELMKLMVVSHLEYAMNYTNQPYPLPWAPHHLGYWPLANLPYTNQENMPLEETAWDLLIIAAIAQRQGGDLTWLQPYWPLMDSWYNYLVTLLPFPGVQLSTDDFDGVLYNATNLAVKGIASMAAYGYIVETYTGNATAAEAAYTTAAQYAATMVQYAWTQQNGSHFMIGYAGSQGDGGDPNSWAMLYNFLWYRLLGYDNLLPNQASLLTQQSAWYTANVMEEFGLPLNSRKLFTKDDWMTFLAATYYNANGTPSTFSNSLFDGFFGWANTTTSREPISDWTNTNIPTAVGFTARPVYGAMYAPMLVAQQAALGMGRADDAAVRHAREVFARVHGEQL